MNRITLNVERLLGSEFGRIIFDIARTALDLEDLLDDLAAYGADVETDVSSVSVRFGAGGGFLALARGRFDAEDLFDFLTGEYETLEEEEHEGRTLLTDQSLSVSVLGDLVVVGTPEVVERCIETHVGVRSAEPGSLEQVVLETPPSPRGDLEVDLPNLALPGWDEDDVDRENSDEPFSTQDIPGMDMATGLGVEALEAMIDLARGITLEAKGRFDSSERAATLVEQAQGTLGRLRDHGAVKTMGLRDLVEAVKLRQSGSTVHVSVRINEHRTWMLLSLTDLAKGFLKRS